MERRYNIVESDSPLRPAIRALRARRGRAGAYTIMSRRIALGEAGSLDIGTRVTTFGETSLPRAAGDPRSPELPFRHRPGAIKDDRAWASSTTMGPRGAATIETPVATAGAVVHPAVKSRAIVADSSDPTIDAQSRDAPDNVARSRLRPLH